MGRMSTSSAARSARRADAYTRAHRDLTRIASGEHVGAQLEFEETLKCAPQLNAHITIAQAVAGGGRLMFGAFDTKARALPIEAPPCSLPPVA